jgi:hypothetical protein
MQACVSLHVRVRALRRGFYKRITVHLLQEAPASKSQLRTQQLTTLHIHTAHFPPCTCWRCVQGPGRLGGSRTCRTE